jgi:signal transduction histidine kinase
MSPPVVDKSSLPDVSATESADSVVISVGDTGIGMPEDQLGRIFEAFVQVDGGIGRSEGGTGLGLALATDVVERMGGQIAVTSTLGSGSVFTVTLPANKASEKPAS